MQTWNAREAREPSWKAQVNMVLELVQALARLGDAEHNKQLVIFQFNAAAATCEIHRHNCGRKPSKGKM